MHISSRANLLHSTFGRTQSLSGRGRVYLPLSILLAVLVCLLVSNATAGSFTATYDLGSLDVADFSIPPHQFFTGPFNYGYTPVGLDGSVNGPVNITSISVLSADATVNFPLVLQNGNIIALDW